MSSRPLGGVLHALRPPAQLAASIRYGTRSATVAVGLAIALLAASACSSDEVVGPTVVERGEAPTRASDAGVGRVSDLTVVSASDSSLSLRWTEVDDGRGMPASYRVRYALPPLDWASASVGCTVAGRAVGAEASCTIDRLETGATYEVQLMAFRSVDGAWEETRASNVVTAVTLATTTASRPEVDSKGIWISRAELLARRTSGPDWERLERDAARELGRADIADQDSEHDVRTFAAALVCVRTGRYCDKARRGVLDAIGTERGARWLAVGRNLAAYVIAADLLGLRRGADADGERVHAWVEGWLEKRLRNNNTSEMRAFHPWHASANAAAQEGFAFAAVAAYLGDERALERAWQGFRTFVCDRGAIDVEHIFMDPPVRDGWTHSDTRPCAVNPAGATRRVPAGRPGAGSVRRIDGALVGDMRRGGTFRHAPGYTQYPWVGLEGLVPAALILHRAGYPAFEAGDRAVLRTHEYLWWLRRTTGDRRWFDGVRGNEVIHLVNVAYGESFPITETVGAGRTVGYTGWTHPTL